MKSLADPFDNPGPRLGWGCLQPTQVVSSYLRGSAIVDGVSGALSLAAVPSVGNLLWKNNAGISTATWTTVASADAAVAEANFAGARVISLGIRAFPSVAQTAAPGVCAVGALPFQSATSLGAMTATDLLAFPTSHVCRGYEGGSSCGRPQDPNSYDFQGQIVAASGWAGGTAIPFSIPYIVFSGLPANTTVYFEVVVNYEALYNMAHGVSPLNSGDQPQAGPTLADEWPNLERMWSTIRQVLPTPGQMKETSASDWNSMFNLGARAALSAARGNPNLRQRYGSLMDAADTFLSF